MDQEYEIDIIVEQKYKYQVDENFIYSWNESVYGIIGYEQIDDIWEDIYINDTLNCTKRPLESSIEVKTSDVVDVVASNYDLVNSDHSYDIQTSFIDGGVFKFLEQYPIYEQPDELWSAVVKDMSCNVGNFDWEYTYDEDYLYQYAHVNVYTELKPQSFIYLIQIIIHNDDSSLEWKPMQCDSLIMNGVSNSRNIQTGKSADDKCNHICQVRPGEDQGDKYVFASRVVSFGIPSAYQSGSSWDISETLKSYLGFKVILFNGIERKVKVDISKKMRELKEGGLITVELNYSELFKESSGGSGFDIGVGEWDEEHHEINI